MKTLAVSLAIVAAGLVLFGRASREPRYLDAGWRETFVQESYSSEDEHERLNAAYWASQETSLNPKAQYREMGLALITAGAALFAVTLAARGFSAYGLLRTPHSRLQWFALGNLAWSLLVPAQWAWLDYTFNRGDYPPWGDTMAIPMGGALFFGLAGLPIVNLMLWASLRGASIPCALLPRWRGKRGRIASLVFLPPFALAVWALVGLVVEGDFFTSPVLASGLYLTLSVWSAAASERAV